MTLTVLPAPSVRALDWNYSLEPGRVIRWYTTKGNALPRLCIPNLSVANSSVMRGRAPQAVLYPIRMVEGPVYKNPVQAHTVSVSLQLQWL